jgi:hypothetical protein
MKRSIIILALLAALSAPSYAQETGDWPKPMTHAGDAALLFGVQGLGVFGIEGPGIAELDNPLFSNDTTNPVLHNGAVFGVGGKYFIADDIALRILLGFNSTSEGADSVLRSFSVFGLGVGAEYHFRPIYSVSPHIGASVGLAFGNFTDSASAPPHSSASTSTFSVGAFAGADWYSTNGVALGAEMGIAFSTRSGSSTVNGKKSDLSSHSGFGIHPASGVHLIVNL